MISEKLSLILWAEEIIVNGYNWVSFLHNFMENLLSEQNAMLYSIMKIYEFNMMFLID